MPRQTDKKDEKMHFQMDRFVQQNGQWYYMTREGEERGPFDTKQDAQGELILHLRQLLKMQDYGITGDNKEAG